MLLEVESITVAYGGLVAVEAVSFGVEEGAMLAIIGPNGAGKSSLFAAISGVAPVTSGRVLLRGADLRDVAPHRRARMGIAHVPEGRLVFGSMSVSENIEVGSQIQPDASRRREAIERSYDLFPALKGLRDRAAGLLSGGQQQMLAIARGLASDPSVLLLDEPSMGLAPAIVDDIFERIQSLRAQGTLTVLLAEQRAVEALESCDSGLVLQSGRVALAGSRKDLIESPRIKALYLGQ